MIAFISEPEVAVVSEPEVAVVSEPEVPVALGVSNKRTALKTVSVQSSRGDDVGAIIDGDYNTDARVETGSDFRSWLKIKLDAVQCIFKVYWYRSGGEVHLGWKCYQNKCRCGYGDFCDRFSFTVSTVGTMPSGLPARTDCVYGDTVKIEKMGRGSGFGVYEMVFSGYLVQLKPSITGTGENYLS